MTTWRQGLALAICAAALACSLPLAPAPAAPRAASDARVVVYFPAGSCSGELELERWDRAARAWRPHPEHPRLPPGACVAEPPGQLLNELRVRCVDPAGRRAPSDWVVGAELAHAAAPCAQTTARP